MRIIGVTRKSKVLTQALEPFIHRAFIFLTYNFQAKENKTIKSFNIKLFTKGLFSGGRCRLNTYPQGSEVFAGQLFPFFMVLLAVV